MNITYLILFCFAGHILSFASEADKPGNYVRQHVYGGKKGHQVFQAQSADAIKWGQEAVAIYVQRAVDTKKPLRSYFNEFLGDETSGLAKFRRDIAFKTNTEAKDVFGKLRASEKKFLLEFTPVRTQWHKDMGDFFHRKLSVLDTNQEHNTIYINSPHSRQTIYLVHQQNCLDENNLEHSRHILVNHYKYNPNHLNNERLTRIAKHESETLDLLFYLLPNTNLRRFIRTEQIKNNGLRIIKFDMHLSLKNTIIPTSIVYGIFKPDASRKNGVSKVSLDLLAQKSFFLVSHTPREYIAILVDLAAEYWEKAILRDKKDVNGIKEDLASVFYIQAHAMPFLRGSEAINKWAIESVARHHGFTINYPKYYAFQKPFYTTMDEFVDDFKSTTRFVTLNTVKKRNRAKTKAENPSQA